MAMTTHTPGPWTLSLNAKDLGAFEIVGCGMTVCRRTRGTPSAEQGIANAHLLVAAPDLLDACRAALNQLTGGWEGDPIAEEWFPNTATVHALAKAIAQAEGR